MSQQYSLRWNNHQPNFISMFTTLLNTQTLVDVTLAAEGKHLRAHKVVLSACSTYFQSVLVENPSQHPIVILKDVTFANLRIMVDFMYYGEVNVTEGQLSQVLETAKMLKIKGLTEMPEPTSLTRTTGTSIDFQEPGDTVSESGRNSPQASPSSRRKRSRKTSSGSGQLNLNLGEERPEEGTSVVRETITLSHVPRRRDVEERIETNQMQESDNMNVEAINIDENQALGHEGGQWAVEAFPRYGGAMQEPMYMCGAMGTHLSGGEVHPYPALGPEAAAGGPDPGPSAAPDLPPPDQPHPAPPRRRRATNPQQEENFQQALEAVRYGGIGFCKAAKMFGVNNRTLWLEYKKRGYPTMRQSIRNRIKRETSTPPLPMKEDGVNANAMVRTQPEQVALLCPQQNVVPVSYMEARQIDFPTFAQSTINNILGVNFNPHQ